MHPILLLASILPAIATEALPMAEARWTSDTIPAISVQLTDPAHAPLEGLRVVMEGPGGETFEAHTDAHGRTTRGFVTAGFWQVTVYDARRPTHQVHVQLLPRQRADLTLHVDPAILIEQDQPFAPPVVDVHSATRGSVFRMGRLAQRPL